MTFDGWTLALEGFERAGEPRLGAGRRVGVDHFVGCRFVELLYKQPEFRLARFEVFGVDRFAHFAKLRANGRLGGAVAAAAHRVLPHAFLGAGCVGHDRG